MAKNQPKKLEIHEEVLCKCKDIADYIDILKNGSELIKFHSSTKCRTRKFFLDLKDMKMYYERSFKRGCHRPDFKIDLIDIVDVREGWKTDKFNRTGSKIEKYRRQSEESTSLKARNMLRKLGPIEESVCFSIIYGDDRNSLDLAARDRNTAEMWVLTLNHVRSSLKEVEQKKRWLKNQFLKADLNKNGALNFDECCKLLKQLNVNADYQQTKKIFEKVNTNKNEIQGEQALDMEEFKELFLTLMSRPEIEEIFKSNSSDGKEMDVDELQNFLDKEQNMKFTKEECFHLISTFEQSDLRGRGKMSFIGFIQLLLSEEFQIFNQKHKTVFQDMTLPLSHYFIASSHNTYLTGGQLSGESSVEGYIEALKAGCLDCWDGPKDEPIVYHGYTLTSKILFRDILHDAIDKYAFKASEYPVILSIENHCSEEQQEKMAHHLKQILKDSLYLVPVEEGMQYLPSPQALKRKIIVKAKKVHSSEDDDDNDYESNGEDLSVNGSKVVQGVNYKLSDLVNICQAVSFHGFQNPSEAKCYQMSSFSESKAEKLIQNEKMNFINYNTKQLSRIYPIALNYQSGDKSTFYNDAKFKQNGNCGYVLKPGFLRNPVKDLEDLKRFWKNWLLNIRIISGQYIPKPDQSDEGEVVDPYVKVAVLGDEVDKQKQKTKPIKNNGFNPRWDHKMVFTIKIPESAILVFTVKDYSSSGVNRKLGTYALPVTSLNTGYRHIYLMDYGRRYLTPASLFVHVSIREE
ncbi:hypothetical protein J437_LFUL016455 [Ladona fulva]|uniref:Phosphoinositide phospholipase C n=1 Tax=Ladona fulva TaxID=123851 RepID=A0A8K0KQT6_LADFU|nr:hypothetical protein J437_LFUL016455 [Ladona fulva]